MRVLGDSVRDNSELCRRVGVMTEREVVYGFLNEREFPESTARLRGLSPIGPAVARALEIFGMADAQTSLPGGYSAVCGSEYGWWRRWSTTRMCLYWASS